MLLGVMNYVDRRVYEGEWKAGKWEGLGVRCSLDTPILPVFISNIDLTNDGNIDPIISISQPTIYGFTFRFTYIF